MAKPQFAGTLAKAIAQRVVFFTARQTFGTKAIDRNRAPDRIIDRSLGLSRLDPSLIADLPAFQELSGGDLDTILSRATALRVAKDAIFEQGGSKILLVLLDGQVRVSGPCPTGVR
ncbi:MAG: hypothetical protein R3D69_09060 [Xanthobacteraceae bacterium]